MSQRRFSNALPNGFKLAGAITLLTGLGIAGLIPGHGAIECAPAQCEVIRGRPFAQQRTPVPLADIDRAEVSRMGRKAQPALLLRTGARMPLVHTADSGSDYDAPVERLNAWLDQARRGSPAPVHIVFNTGLDVVMLGGALGLIGIAFFIYGIRQARFARRSS